MNVFNYTDYRKFLNDFYLERKKKYRYFTVRYIAEKVGFRSASFFSQVINGRSNLSVEMTQKFCVFIGFAKPQSDYFETLVFYNQAKNHSDKKRYFERLSSFKQAKIRLLDTKYFEFYDKWYYSAIRELLYICPCKGEAGKLAKLLSPSISPAQAQKALKLLEKWDLIKKDANGYFVRSDIQSLSTGLETQSFYVNNFNQAVMDLAKQAMDKYQKDTRSFSTLTMSLSRQGYKRFEDEVHQFRRHLLKIAEEDSLEDRVYQMNIQLFPLSKPVSRDDAK